MIPELGFDAYAALLRSCLFASLRSRSTAFGSSTRTNLWMIRVSGFLVRLFQTLSAIW